MDLEINCGSTTLPGRHSKRLHTFWKHAPPAAHRIERAGPKTDGKNQFIEVPVTSKQNWLGFLAKDGDVRLERLTSIDQLFDAATYSLARQRKMDAPVKHLCFLTHNTYDYGDGNSPMKCKRLILETLLDRLPEMADRIGFTPCPGTVPGIANALEKCNNIKSACE